MGGGYDIKDTNSIFSVVSTNANTSINSVTSIISAETISAFKIVDENGYVKHKSKFNRKGRGKNKKGKKQKKSGNKEELKNLMNTLKANIIDEEYSFIVVETIDFIIQNGYISLAKSMYDAYLNFVKTVEISQSDRIKANLCGNHSSDK